jgi:murein L,D-transpeptidase YafK
MCTWVKRQRDGGPLALAAAFLIAAGSNTVLGQSLPDGTVANQVVIEKAARTLKVYSNGRLLKTYRVALGRNATGPKEREGDGRTPEGRYVIDSRKKDSRFHRALHISYPNEEDRRRARRLGVSPGGAIMIHGLPNGMGAIGRAHVARDWTQGCIAVTNEEIEELWRVVPNGTRVEIKP